MDLGRPYRHVSPGVVGAILMTLAPLAKGFSGREIARRAGVSSGRAREVLQDLAASGLVDAEEVSPTILYLLNRDHVLYPAVAAMAGARSALYERIGRHPARRRREGTRGPASEPR